MNENPESVGVILARMLIERSWSQVQLAEIIARPPQLVSEVMTGKKELTRVTAAQFAAAFGTSPKFWLFAQDAHRLSLLEFEPGHMKRLSEIRERAAEAERRHEHAPHLEAICICGDPWCDTKGTRKPSTVARPQCQGFLDTEGGGGVGCLRRVGHRGPHQSFWCVWRDPETAADEVGGT